MPIYCYASVDCVMISYSKEELVPFIKAQLFPSIFEWLLSQLHWKKGDKVVEVSYYEPDHHMHEAIVFKIDEVMMQQGIVRATPIQLIKKDGLQQTHAWLGHGSRATTCAVSNSLKKDQRQESGVLLGDSSSLLGFW